MFSNKSTKNHEIFTVDLKFTEFQINSEDFDIFETFLENMNFTENN